MNIHVLSHVCWSAYLSVYIYVCQPDSSSVPNTIVDSAHVFISSVVSGFLWVVTFYPELTWILPSMLTCWDRGTDKEKKLFQIAQRNTYPEHLLISIFKISETNLNGTGRYKPQIHVCISLKKKSASKAAIYSTKSTVDYITSRVRGSLNNAYCKSAMCC